MTAIYSGKLPGVAPTNPVQLHGHLIVTPEAATSRAVEIHASEVVFADSGPTNRYPNGNVITEILTSRGI